MKLLKNNFYDIIRLYINQIGIAIFSLVLYTAVGMVDVDNLTLTLKILISVFAIIFYFVLLYTVMWEIGAKDKIRVDAGRQERSRFKGLAMGLFANVPNFICAALCVAGQGMFMLYGIEGFKTLGAIFNLIIRLFTSMYLGVLQGVFIGFADNTDLYFLLQSLGFMLLPLLAVLVTHFGYALGMKEKKIFSFKK